MRSPEEKAAHLAQSPNGRLRAYIMLLHNWQSCHLTGFLSEGLAFSPALPQSPFSPEQCTQSALKPILIIPLWLKGIQETDVLQIRRRL